MRKTNAERNLIQNDYYLKEISMHSLAKKTQNRREGVGEADRAREE